MENVLFCKCVDELSSPAAIGTIGPRCCFFLVEETQKKQNACIAKQQFFMRLTCYQSAFKDDCNFEMATLGTTVNQQGLTA